VARAEWWICGCGESNSGSNADEALGRLVTSQKSTLRSLGRSVAIIGVRSPRASMKSTDKRAQQILAIPAPQCERHGHGLCIPRAR
jgi:hypothetical protein